MKLVSESYQAVKSASAWEVALIISIFALGLLVVVRRKSRTF